MDTEQLTVGYFCDSWRLAEDEVLRAAAECGLQLEDSSTSIGHEDVVVITRHLMETPLHEPATFGLEEGAEPRINYVSQVRIHDQVVRILEQPGLPGDRLEEGLESPDPKVGTRVEVDGRWYEIDYHRIQSPTSISMIRFWRPCPEPPADAENVIADPIFEPAEPTEGEAQAVASDAEMEVKPPGDGWSVPPLHGCGEGWLLNMWNDVDFWIEHGKLEHVFKDCGQCVKMIFKDFVGWKYGRNENLSLGLWDLLQLHKTEMSHLGLIGWWHRINNIRLVRNSIEHRDESPSVERMWDLGMPEHHEMDDAHDLARRMIEETHKVCITFIAHVPYDAWDLCAPQRRQEM